MAARGEGPKCYMWSRKMLSWPLKSMIFWSAWARLDLATIRRKGPRSISPSNPVGIATFDDTSNVAAEFAGGRRTSVEPSNVDAATREDQDPISRVNELGSEYEQSTQGTPDPSLPVSANETQTCMHAISVQDCSRVQYFQYSAQA